VGSLTSSGLVSLHTLPPQLLTSVHSMCSTAQQLQPLQHLHNSMAAATTTACAAQHSSCKSPQHVAVQQCPSTLTAQLSHSQHLLGRMCRINSTGQ
jgi:hypothetical protein